MVWFEKVKKCSIQTCLVQFRKVWFEEAGLKFNKFDNLGVHFLFKGILVFFSNKNSENFRLLVSPGILRVLVWSISASKDPPFISRFISPAEQGN